MSRSSRESISFASALLRHGCLDRSKGSRGESGGSPRSARLRRQMAPDSSFTCSGIWLSAPTSASDANEPAQIARFVEGTPLRSVSQQRDCGGSRETAAPPPCRYAAASCGSRSVASASKKEKVCGGQT
eukprot:2863385-Prymnesium_polylepis.1